MDWWLALTVGGGEGADRQRERKGEWLAVFGGGMMDCEKNESFLKKCLLLKKYLATMCAVFRAVSSVG